MAFNNCFILGLKVYNVLKYKGHLKLTEQRFSQALVSDTCHVISSLVTWQSMTSESRAHCPRDWTGWEVWWLSCACTAVWGDGRCEEGEGVHGNLQRTGVWKCVWLRILTLINWHNLFLTRVLLSFYSSGILMKENWSNCSHFQSRSLVNCRPSSPPTLTFTGYTHSLSKTMIRWPSHDYCLNWLMSVALFTI